MASENENEMRETVADIVAELQRCGDKWTNDKAKTTMECLGLIAIQFARRVEAAWKRECEASRAYWTKKCRDTITEHDRYCSPVGNTAAMRESLVKIREDAAFHTLGGAMNPWKIFEICESALSAPARNCDRDLSDRQSIWKEFCQWVRSSSLGCASDPSAGDALEWLLAPAAERKGESDGK